MTPLFLLKALGSLKTEFKIILATIAVLILLPLLAVVVIANAGVTVVASALAAINPITHMVEVKDANGNVIAQLELSTAWPVRGGVTTEFGDPTPYQKHHSGIDIADKAGDTITPFLAGKVIVVQDNAINTTGYGKYVVVDHGNGITSLYAHMSDTVAKLGQGVKPGDVLGLEGATGHVTGVHLHFEIRVYNIPVNPRTFMVGEPAR